jgi:hypothetical protein
VVEQLEQELRDLRKAVADYADGTDEVNLGDAGLMETVDALRRAMEAVYGERITFKGEPGPVSGGQRAVGEVDVREVRGSVTGLRARRIISGTAIGKVKADFVAPGAEAIGLSVDTLGQEAGQSTSPPGDHQGEHGG